MLSEFVQVGDPFVRKQKAGGKGGRRLSLYYKLNANIPASRLKYSWRPRITPAVPFQCFFFFLRICFKWNTFHHERYNFPSKQERGATCVFHVNN